MKAEIKNIFNADVTSEIIARINKLTPETKARWGTMDVARMLAHCCVSYEYVFENSHPRPKPFMRFILKALVKNKVVGEGAYKQNLPTAPEFLIKSEKNFENEKERLVNYLKRTQELGGSHFDGKESHSFGVLTKDQWNNMFYKHIDHHLRQFGV